MARPAPIALAGATALALLLSPGALAAGPEGGLDNRAWEMVSPVQKNGGEVSPLGQGALQAATGGGELAFASPGSFAGAQGAAPLSAYLASRGTEGWATQNLTPPLLSGTYAFPTDPDPYLLFSADLSAAILSGGWSCRDGGEECEAQAPPLGPGGPPGYRNLYRGEGATYTPLVTEANFPALPAEAKEFHPRLRGASPDLRHVLFSASGLLYEWSEGSISQVGGAGAELAAKGNQLGAVSADGSRVYYAEAGNLVLREGATTKSVCEACSFGAASSTGSIAFYLKASHLHRYTAQTEADEDLTPAGGASSILGTSTDASTLYYTATGGLYRWREGAATKVISTSNLEHLPPKTGPVALSADGSRLFLTAADPLIPLKDTDGQPDAYEWEAQGAGSCQKAPGCLALLSSGRQGSASFAAASGDGTDAYFLTSVSLLPQDTGALDAYDARSGGGFPEPGAQVECQGDDCQGPPFTPQDPVPPSATVSGPENPALVFPPAACPKGKKRAIVGGKARCVAKRRRKHKGGHR